MKVVDLAELLFIVWMPYVIADITFAYEKLNRFGLGRRVYDFRHALLNNKEAYPQPLPTSSRSPIAMIGPFERLYQGTRRKGDRRVHNERFHHQAKPFGHKIYSERIFDCILTHLAVETEGGIPIILGGGAGYRYFHVVAKARPGVELKGRIRAYCIDKQEQPKL